MNVRHTKIMTANTNKRETSVRATRDESQTTESDASLSSSAPQFKLIDCRPRRLLVCLDGVPHALIQEARRAGLFAQFREPAKLLSPFPTMTNVALSVMLRSTAPAGYESLYFDRNTKRLEGGMSKYVGRRTPDKIPSSYMDKLDYQEPLPCEFLIYFLTNKVWRADLRRFEESFTQHAESKDFFAFLKATDGLLHIAGAKQLLVALAELDKILTRIHTREAERTEIVVFSDHGMNLVRNRRVPLRTHLETRGFKFTNDLRGSDNGNNVARLVSVPAFGLCGYAAVYCQDEETTRDVAASLCELTGVDFTLHREAETTCVVSERGTARILRQTDGEAVSYAYERMSGDPLQLASVEDELRDAGQIDWRGFASAEAWYERTKEHIYPNALENLYGAMFDKRVIHPADALVSFKDGYYYGASLFTRLAPNLHATHGNAMQPSTDAFLMSTRRELPSHVRASEASEILL